MQQISWEVYSGREEGIRQGDCLWVELEFGNKEEGEGEIGPFIRGWSACVGGIRLAKVNNEKTTPTK